MNNYIAVDIGASSGRLILANIEAGKIVLQEIHRFPNGFIRKNGQDVWEVDKLLKEILKGLSLAKGMGVKSCTMGIDTWGVDYVLVGHDNKRLKDPVCYRDSRTDNSIEQVEKIISRTEHYSKTGIQFLQFNTIYQLYTEPKELLEKTKYILMTPDYLGYELTGKAVTEYTMATTTSMINHACKDWDRELLKIAGVRPEQFAPFAHAGHILGDVLQKWHDIYDIPDCKVIVAPSHDTAAAVAAAPGKGDWAFLSSGTWSVLGMELNEPIVTDEALLANYSNEGGIGNTYRFLKNIMGMWLIQGVRKSLGEEVSYAYLVEQAEKITPYKYYIDPSHHSFLNPDNMIEAIQNYCKEQGGPVPQTPGELARCVYDSLALFYKAVIEELETLTGKHIERIIIIGGGSKNNLLNKITAELTGKTVVTGPVEASALGNIISQLIAMNVVSDIQQARELVERSLMQAVSENPPL